LAGVDRSALSSLLDRSLYHPNFTKTDRSDSDLLHKFLLVHIFSKRLVGR